MADVTETRQLYDPQLTGSRTALLSSVDKLGAGLASQLANYQGLDVSKFAPKIAAQDALQTGAASAAAGLGALTGTGVGDASVQGSIASYMSPYQQQVMDASLAEFDRKAAMDNVSLRDAAISRGAYGGGREGVMAAEALRGQNMDRATLQAQLLNQGFQQAQAARAADLTAQQGLGAYQQQIGQAQQGYNQALLDASQVAAREEQYSPFTQIGLIGQQLSQMTPGTYPITTTTSTPPAAAPVSPLQQFIGGAGAIGGVLGKLLD
tara:strand:- start:89 stop:883 length:795 start_codon:yes stop_codon:yes gene_type:complete